MYTYTYTRTSTLVDQVDIFLKSSGIGDVPREKVINGVNEKWLVAVGVFIEENGKRVLEGSLEISWKEHSDHAELAISAELPGWEDGLAPELSVLAKWLVEYANAKKLTLNFWVRFTKEISDDPVLYPIRCKAVGVGGTVPAWKSTPKMQKIPMQDLPEAQVALLDAR